MGMIIPDMGTKSGPSRGLADALFSPVQQRVLGLLYGQPQRRFQSAELIRLAGSGTGVDAAGRAHKARVIDAAIARHGIAGASPEKILCAVGGLEMVTPRSARMRP